MVIWKKSYSPYSFKRTGIEVGWRVACAGVNVEYLMITHIDLCLVWASKLIIHELKSKGECSPERIHEIWEWSGWPIGLGRRCIVQYYIVEVMPPVTPQRYFKTTYSLKTIHITRVIWSEMDWKVCVRPSYHTSNHDLLLFQQVCVGGMTYSLNLDCFRRKKWAARIIVIPKHTDWCHLFLPIRKASNKVWKAW